jgi:hypothetical protein
MTTIKAIGAIAFGLSAICWIIAATLATPVFEIYFYGRSKTMIDRLATQWKWNAAAAWLAALASAIQSL